MFTAKPLLCPSIRITAVTAATDISFQPNFVALMIALFKAILTNNASRILLTSLTFPCNIPIG